MKIITAFFMAWGYFLALPCPYKKWDNSVRHYMLAFLPAVGMVAGAIWCLFNYVVFQIGMPGPLASLISMMYIFFISGFFHLDGFMDSCDALLSQRDLAERQRILKDSTVGAFSVISVMLLIASWVVIYVMTIGKLEFWQAFLIPTVSRTMSAIWVLILKPIGHSQYKDGFSNEERSKALVMTLVLVVVGIGISVFMAYPAGDYMLNPLIVAGAMIGASTILTMYATKQLGGMSGDISGFGLCLIEFVGVFTVALLI